MPCNDTTSRAIVRLNENERLKDFDFSKITCGKNITSEAGYEEFCKGLSVDEILRIDYNSMAEKMALIGDAERFLLYLEWSALRSALAQYKGLEAGDGSKIATIEYHSEGVEIYLAIEPPKEMPKRIPSCVQQEKKLFE